MGEEVKEIYNIAIAPNEHYVKYMLVLMQSLFDTNKEKTFRFFILYSQLKEETIKIVSDFLSVNEATGEFVQVQNEKYSFFPTKERLTVETYFRLDVQDILPNNIDRLLYLDCDMIVCGDLEELYHTNFENKYLVACGFSPRCECGTDFNAGMLLFNMPKMREDISFETYCKLATELKGDYYLDQGLLNYQFAQNGTKYVWKEKYNFTCPFYRKFEKEIKKIFPQFSFEDVVIMHFAGPGIRPWELRMDKQEYMQLSKKNLLKIFADNNYIIDDVYVHFLQKWWEIAAKTPFYEELLHAMYQSKMQIFYKILCEIMDSKEYEIGYRIMKLPRMIRRILK